MNNLTYIPPEDADKIRAAAEDIMMRTPAMVDLNANYVLGAVALALGHIAAIMKVPYKDLITLISSHYEHALLDELKTELKKEGLTLPPKLEEPN